MFSPTRRRLRLRLMDPWERNCHRWSFEQNSGDWSMWKSKTYSYMPGGRLFRPIQWVNVTGFAPRRHPPRIASWHRTLKLSAFSSEFDWPSLAWSSHIPSPNGSSGVILDYIGFVLLPVTVSKQANHYFWTGLQPGPIIHWNQVDSDRPKLDPEFKPCWATRIKLLQGNDLFSPPYDPRPADLPIPGASSGATRVDPWSIRGVPVFPAEEHVINRRVEHRQTTVL